jgi:hypothetical protein
MLYFILNLLKDLFIKKDLLLFKVLKRIYINVILKSIFINLINNFDKDFLFYKSYKLNKIIIIFIRLLILAF